MIQLGLSRIKALVQGLPQTFHAIHVAGTNGKGSVSTFISRALKDLHIDTGRFTSPHLIDVRESISVNGYPISREKFSELHRRFELRSQWQQIGATPFELLTATAFQAFNEQKVSCAVFECGMGGARDATNGVLSAPAIPALGKDGKAPSGVVGGGEDLKAAVVITKVGLDHQEFLGDNLREITLEKCGIFAPSSRVIFDETNSAEVIRQIRHSTRAKQTWPIVENFHYWPRRPPPNWNDPKVGPVLEEAFKGQPHMLANARVAYNVVVNVHPIFYRNQELNHGDVAKSIANTRMLGRMQPVNLAHLTGNNVMLWLDGAHNKQAMDAVGPVFKDKRKDAAKALKLPDDDNVAITWMLGFSGGKSVEELLTQLDIRPGDRIIATEFGPVEGMPWKEPLGSTEIYEYCKQRYPDCESRQYFAGSQHLEEALQWGSTFPDGQPGLVVCTGSLYLVSDVLKLIRDKMEKEQGKLFAERLW
jgi:folylpolyglutamate synthase/dihydropteroate synthase